MFCFGRISESAFLIDDINSPCSLNIGLNRIIEFSWIIPRCKLRTIKLSIVPSWLFKYNRDTSNRGSPLIVVFIGLYSPYYLRVTTKTEIPRIKGGPRYLGDLPLMELFVETLTGTAFELRVSPFETIMSVKAKIQRLEGIPIAQQHLIWQSVELEDDYCLHDYSISSGSTLKLVLAMRGGPINTRRVPIEDSSIREMADYMDANHDEYVDKMPSSRHVTLLVFREGDQLNFFRVVDRGDGTLTPLSETMSTSAYNFNDEDDDEDGPPREKIEENDKMKEKMSKLRFDMDKLSISKKKPLKPLPPLGKANLPSAGQSNVSVSDQSSLLSLVKQSVSPSCQPNLLSVQSSSSSHTGVVPAGKQNTLTNKASLLSHGKQSTASSQTSLQSVGKQNSATNQTSLMSLRKPSIPAIRSSVQSLGKQGTSPSLSQSLSRQSVSASGQTDVMDLNQENTSPTRQPNILNIDQENTSPSRQPNILTLDQSSGTAAGEPSVQPSCGPDILQLDQQSVPPSGEQNVQPSGEPNILNLDKPNVSTSGGPDELMLEQLNESSDQPNMSASGDAPVSYAVNQPSASTSSETVTSSASNETVTSSSAMAGSSTSNETLVSMSSGHASGSSSCETLVSSSQTRVHSSGRSSMAGVTNPPSRTSSRMRLRQISSSTSRHPLNKNVCLPPVGRTVSSHSVAETNSSVDLVPFLAPGAADDPKFWSDGSDNGGPTLDVVNENSDDDDAVGVNPAPSKKSLDVHSDESGMSFDTMMEILSKPPDVLPNPFLKYPELEKYETMAAITETIFELDPERYSTAKKKSSENGSKSPSTSADESCKRSTSGLHDSRSRLQTSSSRHSGIERRKEFALESLSRREARAMSGLLQQASIEKIGSSRIGNFVSTSATSTRLSSYSNLSLDARVGTPETGLMSAHLSRLSISQDPRSQTNRLPPVKPKRKSKRCEVCSKKTGLATSYMCRCGKNFCATHRYAESHGCTFDYKTEGRKLLQQNNPVVSAPKLPKI